MTQEPVVPKSAYAGLFFTALATLMFEILLTRIFSATTWYHFAFMAVSVAMFGMTAGALAVYLLPRVFTVENALRQLGRSTLWFSLAIPVCFLAHLCIPFEESLTVVGVFSFALTYFVVAVPFFFSGIAVCIALTKFPGRVSSLYAVDLTGAGIGCIALLYTLRLTDGPSAMLVVAALAALGSFLFSMGAGRGAPRVSALLVCVVLAGLAGWGVTLVEQGDPLIKLTWVKGAKEGPIAYERWNSFSRITVRQEAGGEPSKPFGWGLSSKTPTDQLLRQYGLFIDGVAGTAMTEFDGSDTSKLGFLKWDVTNIAHYLRPAATVLVVGTGGGRDLLSALVFDQKQVIGVELNQDILRSVNERFGDFSGHLDRHPKIRLINDEARSYIARSDEHYDLLQISLIDTWAATTAGAFVLAENALYTTEGWRVFLDHLEPKGLLTVSRWYRPAWPSELYRMTALAAESLQQRGIEHPEQHIAVVTSDIVANLMVSVDPIDATDIATLQREAERMAFTVRLAAGEAEDQNLATLARGGQLTKFPGGIELDLSPPTDDRPFFFNMLHLRDVFKPEVREMSSLDSNLKAVMILAVLLGVVIVLTTVCIVLPLVFSARRVKLGFSTVPLFLFFASIGFGFMLVELSQMHRLILFLGHPTYGLSVVLFALLLSSGIGSMFSQRFTDPGRAGVRVLLALLGVLGVFGLVTPWITGGLEWAVTPVRIGMAVALLFPLGFLMGMAFPLGLRIAAGRNAELTPWLWGVNGATSVCATVLATGIALTLSISTAFWAGVACYGLALLAFTWARVGAGKADAGGGGCVDAVDTDAVDAVGTDAVGADAV